MDRLIQGCASSACGVGRTCGSFSRLCVVYVCRPTKGRGRDARSLEKILDGLGPLGSLVIGENRGVHLDDVAEELDRPEWRLALGGKREAAGGDLVQGEAEGPDVGGDGIGGTGDPLRLCECVMERKSKVNSLATHGHVVTRAGERGRE